MLSQLKSLTNDSPLGRTFSYYLLFICLGLGLGMAGPTLPSLADQTHTLLSEMGLVFLVGSLGYTLGTMISGPAFERLPSHRLLGIAQILVAGLIALIPIVSRLELLLGVLLLKGIADGVINAGSNTLLIWTHREKVGPYLNALHFFFGLGAFLAPFLVAQLLGLAGGYRWAFWGVSLFAILAGLRVLLISETPRPPQTQSQVEAEVTPSRAHYPLVIVAALFLFFYVGAELAFGGWIYTYAITLKLADAAGAAYLNSGFWLSFTVGRLLSIPLAIRFKPTQVIGVASLGGLAFLGLLISFPNSRNVLWIAVVALGFFMAPLWASGFNLASQSLNLTARLSSFILLGDSFGGMVLPWLVGRVLGIIGPAALAYLVLGSLACNLVAFIGMLRLRPTGQPIPTAIEEVKVIG
jgi:MFS transporter, FHS family, Na+ dependent glucose transporter 1